MYCIFIPRSLMRFPQVSQAILPSATFVEVENTALTDSLVKGSFVGEYAFEICILM